MKDIPVTPIPGPSALITALSAAGVPCDSFVFTGFLPAKQSARRQKLMELLNQPYTVVFYESTHRILDCLEDIAFIYKPECTLVVAKELTKAYERFISGTVTEIVTWFNQDPGHCKGEFVVIIPPQPALDNTASNDAVLRVLLDELPLKQAVSLACKLTKGNKNELYQQALAMKQ
jgi:16S rRNA (cytidine1402-2'-O)-methyltransferase